MRTRIAIITATRAGGVDTLNPTIESILATDHTVSPDMVGVFHDGLREPELRTKVGYVQARSQPELDRFKALPKYFGSFNFSRALRWAADQTDAVVVTDDDVLLTRNWLQKATGLYESAQEFGPQRPIIAFQHFYPTTDAFVPSEAYYANTQLWYPGPEATSNGLFPAFMGAETAADLADVVEGSYAVNESDYAVFRYCTTHGKAILLYADPCLAEHMNVASHFAGNYPKELLRTKRFQKE